MVPIYTNCEDSESISEGIMMVMEMEMLLKMVMKILLPTPREIWWNDGVDFPSVAAVEQLDLPSPREEEDFRLRRLRKVHEKLGVGFSTGQGFCKKEEVRRH
jgi:hypothetical protein